MIYIPVQKMMRLLTRVAFIKYQCVTGRTADYWVRRVLDALVLLRAPLSPILNTMPGKPPRTT